MNEHCVVRGCALQYQAGEHVILETSVVADTLPVHGTINMETGSETETNVVNRDTVLVIAVSSVGLDTIGDALIKVIKILGKHPNDGNCQDKEDVEMFNDHSQALAVRGGKAR